MRSPFLTTPRARHASRLVLAIAGALLASCAIPPPEVDAGADIARAVGLSETVVFRTQAGPLDAPSADAAELTAAAAVRRAIETSAELQGALARVHVAQRDAELAGAAPNPVLDVVLRVPAGHGGTIVEAGLTADLLALLQRPGRAEAAGHRLHGEAAHAVSAALDVVAAAQLRYAEVQVLQELLPVLEQRLAVLDRLLEVAQVRLELGAGSRHDVTTLATDRAELVIEVEEQRHLLRVARLALAREIGEPSGAAAWRLEPWVAPEPLPLDEGAWLQAALSSRPELAAIGWELRARGAEEELAGGLAYEGTEAGVAAELEDEWSVGPAFAVPLPLFDSGDRRRDRASALSAETRHLLTAAQRDVIEDVRAELGALATAQGNLARVVDDLLPLQEQRRREIEEAWKLGQVDVTRVLLADEALQRAHARRIELEREVSSAHIRLQRAAGGPIGPQAALPPTEAHPESSSHSLARNKP